MDIPFSGVGARAKAKALSHEENTGHRTFYDLTQSANICRDCDDFRSYAQYSEQELDALLDAEYVNIGHNPRLASELSVVGNY